MITNLFKIESEQEISSHTINAAINYYFRVRDIENGFKVRKIGNNLISAAHKWLKFNKLIKD